MDLLLSFCCPLPFLMVYGSEIRILWNRDSDSWLGLVLHITMQMCVCLYTICSETYSQTQKVLKLERIFLLKPVAARADQIIFLDLLVIVFLTHPRVLLAAFAVWLTAGSWSICCLPAGQPGGPFFAKLLTQLINPQTILVHEVIPLLRAGLPFPFELDEIPTDPFLQLVRSL